MHFTWQQILLRLFCSTYPMATIWRALHSLDSGVYINNLKHGCRWYRKFFTALWSWVVLDAKTWSNQAKTWGPIYQSKFLDFWWPEGSFDRRNLAGYPEEILLLEKLSWQGQSTGGRRYFKPTKSNFDIFEFLVLHFPNEFGCISSGFSKPDLLYCSRNLELIFFVTLHSHMYS